MPILKSLIVAGAAGIAISLVCLIALHALPSPVKPLRDAICDHASLRFGFLFRLQCAATGMSGICLIALLVRSGYIGPSYGAFAHLGVTALIVFALSRIAIIFFPSDLGPPRTKRGIVHMALDVLMFIGISYGSGFINYYLIHNRFPGGVAWAGVDAMLWMTAALIELCSVLTIFTVSVPAFRRFMGLNERFLYLGILLWLGAAFMPMLSLP